MTSLRCSGEKLNAIRSTSKTSLCHVSVWEVELNDVDEQVDAEVAEFQRAVMFSR